MAINIDNYLKDINPDQVCGADLQYDPAFIELEQAIKGKPEQQMGDIVIEAEPPNWREIKKRSEDLLARSIDLRVAVCYLRALVALEGFSGLQDCLALMDALVEKRWYCLHPQLDPDDDNDPTERVNVLLSLCDFDSLLKPLQLTSLVESKAVGRFNYRDISIATGKSTATGNENPTSLASLNAAVQDAELAQLQQTFQAVSASFDATQKLEQQVTDYVGINHAPSFAELAVFLKESQGFLAGFLEQRGVNDELVAEGTPEGVAFAPPAKSIAGGINNNQDVIRVLSLVCEYYKRHEPSSPVPQFITRAIGLVGKDFMAILEDIAPDGMTQATRVLGKNKSESE